MPRKKHKAGSRSCQSKAQFPSAEEAAAEDGNNNKTGAAGGSHATKWQMSPSSAPARSASRIPPLAVGSMGSHNPPSVGAYHGMFVPSGASVATGGYDPMTAGIASLHHAAQYHPQLWQSATSSAHPYARNPAAATAAGALYAVGPETIQHQFSAVAAASYAGAADPRFSAVHAAIPAMSALASLAATSAARRPPPGGAQPGAHRMSPSRLKRLAERDYPETAKGEDETPIAATTTSSSSSVVSAPKPSSADNAPKQYPSTSELEEEESNNSTSERNRDRAQSSDSVLVATAVAIAEKHNSTSLIAPPIQATANSAAVYCRGLQSKEVVAFAEKDLKRCIDHWGYLRRRWRSHRCTVLFHLPPADDAATTMAKSTDLSQNFMKSSSSEEREHAKKKASEGRSTEDESVDAKTSLVVTHEKKPVPAGAAHPSTDVDHMYSCKECLAEIENNLSPDVHPELFPSETETNANAQDRNKSAKEHKGESA
jgi:hypothetical protein